MMLSLRTRCPLTLSLTTAVVFATACGGPTAGSETDAAADTGIASDAGDSGPPRRWQELLDQTAWVAEAAQDDLWPSHRPPALECSAEGWYVESNNLEANTGECNYISLVQPLSAALEAGETLRVVGYYFDLSADAPAEAHIAVALGDWVLWEETVPIPSVSKVFSPEVVTPMAFEAGTPLHFHLHNHGQNSWTLRSLAVSR